MGHSEHSHDRCISIRIAIAAFMSIVIGHHRTAHNSAICRHRWPQARFAYVACEHAIALIDQADEYRTTEREHQRGRGNPILPRWTCAGGLIEGGGCSQCACGGT